jgi:hypothetical protein
MERSLSREAGSRTASQIPGLLWNSKLHSRFLNSPPLDLILSQMNPIHTPTAYFFKIILKIVVSMYALVSKVKQKFSFRMWISYTQTYFMYFVVSVCSMRLSLNFCNRQLD